jgi:hypothetical protein
MEIVNGYVCQNCTDTALAARNIDPAHPKDGPFGRDKPQDPSRPAHGPAVTLDGLLKGGDIGPARPAANAPGAALDLSA